MIATPLVAAFLLFQAVPPSFEVTAGGRQVELHEFPRGVFGQFEVREPVEVEVRANFDIRWVDIRPLSAGIVPTLAPDHLSFRFRVAKPVPLTIEFNGEWKRVIHLFANAPEQDAPTASTANVRYFGPGRHEAGAIRMKDGETVYLAPGAWVRGSISATGAKNVTIRGRGVLEWAAGEPGARRNMVYLEDTQGARVEGITLVNSPTWTVYARRSDNTHVDGVRILNGGGACTSDGIDLVSSSNVLVENVFIRTNDDNVVVKNMDSRDVHDITVRKAVIWNEPCGNALEIGFELRTGSIRKVRFEDIDVIRVERGAVLSIHNADAAVVEDITYEDIRVEDARHKLLDFSIVYGRYGPDRPQGPDPRVFSDAGGAWDGVFRVTDAEHRARLAANRGHVRNIRVRNLRVIGALPFSIISGWDKEHAVEGVRIEGMTVNGQAVRGAEAARISAQFAPGLEVR